MTEPMPQGVHTIAGMAAAENGQVVLDGPDGVTATMSPDAAEETGRALIAAATEARRQGT